jgi:hypothetical protein
LELAESEPRPVVAKNTPRRSNLAPAEIEAGREPFVSRERQQSWPRATGTAELDQESLEPPEARKGGKSCGKNAAAGESRGRLNLVCSKRIAALPGDQRRRGEVGLREGSPKVSERREGIQPIKMVAASFLSFFPLQNADTGSRPHRQTGINCIQLAKQQTHEGAKEIIARIKNSTEVNRLEPANG